jgi:hypothetical protein
MKSGDRVTTPDGPGVLRGFDKRVTLNAGKPLHEAWIMVELDAKRGKCRWFVPKQVRLQSEPTPSKGGPA